MNQLPRFEISPDRALVDVPLRIRLNGLSPGQRVTLRSTAVVGGTWQAEALFEADASGRIDVERQAPVSGSYADADAMGLVWSAKQTAPPTDTSPWDPLAPIHLTFDALIDEEVVASQTVERQTLADGVRREQVRDAGLFGTLFIPEGPGPHPAVTIVSGSGGGLWEPLGALYAAHGYAGFALAYFNYETLPKALVDIPLEYFEAAIEYLGAREDIDRERLAIMGASRGGELALLLASQFAQLKAVVAVVPSGLVWAGFGGRPEDGVQPAWLRDGKPIPFMGGERDPDLYRYVQAYRERGEAIPTTPTFLARMEKDPARVRQATIPVEKIRGPVLMISGEDDQMWPSTPLAEVAVERLRAHDFAHPYEHLRYPGAGHAIGVPYAPTTVVESKHPVDGTLYAFGGDAKANMSAGEDSWRKTLAFLERHL